MSSNSRKKNAILNISIGYISQICILLLSFVSRKIFVVFLPIDYLGINGLYSNVLSVLSITELGLGSVMQFSLYKPVVDNNKDLINALLRYYKKIYYLIALTITVLGLLLIPFLRYIVKSELKQSDLITYYILFLINSVVSYFVAHKIALLSANQDNRLQKIINMFSTVGLQFLHILVLVMWKNYIVYIIVTLLTTIASQIILSSICNKRYPYIKNRVVNATPDKKNILKNIKSTFIYKIGTVIINNTDNILISMIVGTATVGLYSNYCLIVNAVQGFISIITVSLISGVGNMSVEKNKDKMNKLFNSMLLFYHFIAAFGGICFYFLLSDFISIWLGGRFVLDNYTVFAIAFNYYLTNAISPIWMYRESNGLFVKVKYLMLTTAIANIALSIVFGVLWGTFGILLASAIARITTAVWYEPFVLFNNVFDTPVKQYWIKQLKYLILTISSVAVCLIISKLIPDGLIFILIKAVIYMIICSLVFIVSNIKSEEISYIKNIVRGIIKKKKIA
ncbi:MAG: oligosaccharide flippase family protein [Oscillospiraceae bacterium]|nr:oligosaccharide flippase family protein [Oscillospiraceae bacterium]